MLDALCQLIPADLVSFFGLHSSDQAEWFMQGFPAEEPGGDDDGAAFWAHYWDCVPCCYPDRSGDLRSVTKISDFYSARQWHATGMYHDYFQPGGIDHELMLCLPAGPGRAGRCGWSSSAAPGRTSPSGTVRCSPCSARTRTRPMSRRNAAGAA